MTFNGWLQILTLFLVVLAITKPLGHYMYRVFEGAERPSRRVLAPIERWLLRLCGASASDEQSWIEYTVSLLIFSAHRRSGYLRHPAPAASLAVQPARAGAGCS